MAKTCRKLDADFREGAVRLVRETGKPIAHVARDLGINPGTLGNWVNADKRRRGDGSGALMVSSRSCGPGPDSSTTPGAGLRWRSRLSDGQGRRRPARSSWVPFFLMLVVYRFIRL